MRITENTDERLVVEERPVAVRALLWFLAGALGYSILTVDEEPWRVAVAVAVLAGLVAITVTGFPTIRFVFDRQAGRLFRTRWFVGLRREDGMALSEIRAVRQEARWSGGSRGRRLVIETDAGPSAMTPSHGNRDLAPVAEAITEWLSRPDSPA